MNRMLRVASAVVVFSFLQTAHAACDVAGDVRIDPSGDVELTPDTSILYTLIYDTVPPLDVPGVPADIPALDVERLTACYDSIADEYEYRITVRDAASPPKWGIWAMRVGLGYRAVAGVSVYTGIGSTYGFRLFRFFFDSSSTGSPACMGPVTGVREGNTFVMRVARQRIQAAVLDDLAAYSHYSLHDLLFFTGTNPAPRLLSAGGDACGWPAVYADD